MFNSNPQAKRQSNGLTYYKCIDCLTAFTAKEEVKECLCGGKLECMGEVFGGQYKRVEEKYCQDCAETQTWFESEQEEKPGE